MPSPVKRSSVPSWSQDQLARGGVVFAKHAHHVLRLDGLGEGGEAPQVAEHDRDVAAVAAEGVVGAAAEDGLGELWREEAAELADALELGDLLGDALLERRVPLR